MKREHRIGIFGGSFDPVHMGHIKLALSAKREYNLDKVIFVPAYRPPHKTDKKLLPGSLRVKMLSLALRRFHFFSVDKFELNRRAVTYTYSTIEHFKNKYRGGRLFFIVGSDSLAQFRSWKNPEKILQNAELLVGRRKGAAAKAPARFRNEVHFLKSRIPEVSSTDIRKGTRTALDPAVKRYILNHGTYNGKSN